MLSVADCLEIIKERAQASYGDKWLAELAKKYVAILQQQGDEKATYANRKRTVYRAFEEQSCSAETLFSLIQAVNCKLQIACTEIKILQ